MRFSRAAALVVLLAICAKGADRAEAIARGLRFVYATAKEPRNFKAYSSDYLWCFYSIAATSKDPELVRMASEMGRERARFRLAQGVKLPANAGPGTIAELVFEAYALQQLGFPDDDLKARLRQAAARFKARDFLGFDPATEPPPANTRYDAWDDALITTYTGDSYGVTLGATFRDAVKWLPKMRPYPTRASGTLEDFYAALYAITHLVYTLNGYSFYRLSPAWLPDEYAYLKANLTQAVKLRDPETMGEFLDTLRSFGMTEDDPLMRTGVRFLLRTQNRDGSWGNPKDRDIYNRYHSTWTAIDGLREYSWHGERLSFPELRELLR